LTHDIQFTPGGAREFGKLEKQIQKRVLNKVYFYLRSGNPLAFAKPLVNLPPATHRFRVGKYRLTFCLQGNRLVIDGVDTREDAYRRR